MKVSYNGVMYFPIQQKPQPFSDLELKKHFRQGSPISTQNVPEAQSSEGRAEVAFIQVVSLLNN